MIGVLNQPTTKQAFKTGLLFGFVFMAGFHSWILELRAWGPFVGVIIMWLLYSAYLSLFYGALAATLHKFRSTLWVFPVIWVVFEYVKSISVVGNTAGSLGYTLGLTPLFNQPAALGGVFFLSFLILSTNTLLLYGINLRPKYSYKHFAGALCLIALWGTYGLVQLKISATPTDYKTISIIQPNHPQEKKLYKYAWGVLRNDHLRLLEKTIITHKPSMIFLPETITPGLNTKRKHFMHPLSNIAAQNNVGIFFGTPIKRESKYYNSIALMTPQGLAKESYDKVQLMPFGEYWPAKSLFLTLGLDNVIPGSEFTPGKGFWPLRFQSTEVGALVCLESIYPWFSRTLVKNNASLLYVAANNAWFFDSSAAQKHLQMSVLRAVETHRTLIHATNTGLSGFVTPKGQIRHLTTLDTQAILSETVPLYTNKTIYTKLGESWLLILVLLSGLYLKLKTFRKS